MESIVGVFIVPTILPNLSSRNGEGPKFDHPVTYTSDTETLTNGQILLTIGDCKQLMLADPLRAE